MTGCGTGSGLDLQRELIKAGIQIPIIFIAGCGDLPMSVWAMKAGAVEFLTKPFRNLDLLDAQAIGGCRAARESQAKLADLQGHYNLLCFGWTKGSDLTLIT